MAISRSREYEADRKGAEICGNPHWLASALEKLQNGAQQIDNNAAERNPATAHLFIVNPLHARSVDSLFSTLGSDAAAREQYEMHAEARNAAQRSEINALRETVRASRVEVATLKKNNGAQAASGLCAR